MHLVYAPKILHKHCLRFLLGRLGYVIFFFLGGGGGSCGINKVHYGLGEKKGEGDRGSLELASVL